MATRYTLVSPNATVVAANPIGPVSDPTAVNSENARPRRDVGMVSVTRTVTIGCIMPPAIPAVSMPAITMGVRLSQAMPMNARPLNPMAMAHISRRWLVPTWAMMVPPTIMPMA